MVVYGVFLIVKIRRAKQGNISLGQDEDRLAVGTRKSGKYS